jgi:hypothetical protein
MYELMTPFDTCFTAVSSLWSTVTGNINTSWKAGGADHHRGRSHFQAARQQDLVRSVTLTMLLISCLILSCASTADKLWMHERQVGPLKHSALATCPRVWLPCRLAR